MNVTWTGKQEQLHPKQKLQLDSKFAKLGKLLDVDGQGDKQARVVLAADKNMYRAEITLNYLDHTLVAEHVDADQFTALNHAIERLERQMLKFRERRRDKKGSVDKSATAELANDAPATPLSAPGVNGKPKVFRVKPADGKPLTAEEAMLMIDDEPYLVYLNAGTDRLAVLLRRGDGNFDLVEC